MVEEILSNVVVAHYSIPESVFNREAAKTLSSLRREHLCSEFASHSLNKIELELRDYVDKELF